MAINISTNFRIASNVSLDVRDTVAGNPWDDSPLIERGYSSATSYKGMIVVNTTPTEPVAYLLTDISNINVEGNWTEIGTGSGNANISSGVALPTEADTDELFYLTTPAENVGLYINVSTIAIPDFVLLANINTNDIIVRTGDSFLEDLEVNELFNLTANETIDGTIYTPGLHIITTAQDNAATPVVALVARAIEGGGTGSGIASGITLPITPLAINTLFNLTAIDGTNQIGLYINIETDTTAVPNFVRVDELGSTTPDAEDYIVKSGNTFETDLVVNELFNLTSDQDISGVIFTNGLYIITSITDAAATPATVFAAELLDQPAALPGSDITSGTSLPTTGDFELNELFYLSAADVDNQIGLYINRSSVAIPDFRPTFSTVFHGNSFPQGLAEGQVFYLTSNTTLAGIAHGPGLYDILTPPDNTIGEPGQVTLIADAGIASGGSFRNGLIENELFHLTEASRFNSVNHLPGLYRIVDTIDSTGSTGSVVRLSRQSESILSRANIAAAIDLDNDTIFRLTANDNDATPNRLAGLYIKISDTAGVVTVEPIRREPADLGITIGEDHPTTGTDFSQSNVTDILFSGDGVVVTPRGIGGADGVLVTINASGTSPTTISGVNLTASGNPAATGTFPVVLVPTWNAPTGVTGVVATISQAGVADLDVTAANGMSFTRNLNFTALGQSFTITLTVSGIDSFGNPTGDLTDSAIVSLTLRPPGSPTINIDAVTGFESATPPSGTNLFLEQFDSGSIAFNIVDGSLGDYTSTGATTPTANPLLVPVGNTVAQAIIADQTFMTPGRPSLIERSRLDFAVQRSIRFGSVPGTVTSFTNDDTAITGLQNLPDFSTVDGSSVAVRGILYGTTSISGAVVSFNSESGDSLYIITDASEPDLAVISNNGFPAQNAISLFSATTVGDYKVYLTAPRAGIQQSFTLS